MMHPCSQDPHLNHLALSPYFNVPRFLYPFQSGQMFTSPFNWWLPWKLLPPCMMLVIACVLLGLLLWCKQVPLAPGSVCLWLLRASFPSRAHLSNYRVNGWVLRLRFAWCCSWFCFLTCGHASLTLPFSSLIDRKVYSGCEHFTGYILAGNYSMWRTFPWRLAYTWLGATMWVLGMNPGPAQGSHCF